jgi:hypothetical protein
MSRPLPEPTEADSFGQRLPHRCIAFRPRGFAPPRRFTPGHGVRACCIPEPDVRFDVLRRPPTGHSRGRPDRTGRVPTPRFTPFEDVPSSAAVPHRCGRCPLAVHRGRRPPRRMAPFSRPRCRHPRTLRGAPPGLGTSSVTLFRFAPPLALPRAAPRGATRSRGPRDRLDAVPHRVAPTWPFAPGPDQESHRSHGAGGLGAGAPPRHRGGRRSLPAPRRGRRPGSHLAPTPAIPSR